MPLSQAVISFDISDLAGADFDARRTKVYATTNVPGGAVIDTDGNKVYLGSGNATVNTDGTGTISVPIPGTGSNPASWQTTIHVDYPDRNSARGRTTRSFGPFTITASANLADLVAEQDVPPEYASGLLAEMTALRDATATISGLTGEDAAIANRINTPGSQTDTALKATYARPAAIIRSTASMSSWLDKVAAVRAGTASAKVLFIGDSLTAGVFSGATLATSYPTAVKRRLGLHMPVADGLALPTATISMDPRWVKGGYAYSSGVGPAGASWEGSTAAGADLTFTPTGSVDTFDVWAYHNGGNGTIATKIDGAAVASIVCGTGSGWTKTTYTVTAGTHTIQLPKPTIGTVYILGVDAYLSTNKSVRVGNWGVSGSATGNWNNASGGLFSLSAITAYAPDLSVISLGVNDAATPVSATDYGTRLGALIDTCKGTGNVVLVSPIQSNPTTGRVDDEQVYRDKMYELAASKDVPLIDAFNLYGAYSTAEALWADDLHLTAKGYARLGRMVYDGLMAV